MKHTINVVTRVQDNGDGGYTMSVYNNNEEMLADHHRIEEAETEEEKEKIKQEILNENDPYEDGYLGTDTIDIEIVDGVAKLASSISLHAGQ